jgi:hypothetical protein
MKQHFSANALALSVQEIKSSFRSLIFDFIYGWHLSSGKNSLPFLYLNKSMF